ncbi:hypothetical protein K488DRAFT_82027 [Vararia minispora EC-137]|uniref:Uncharacterized protein n=1 Tax=Vararia minispora EC-137 TaxID=1314806 RepID=A0ACB8QXH8_9AGAM|nr:hypothetical protein K488DRAFT_82027 [Vararia minispora EC-137]
MPASRRSSHRTRPALAPAPGTPARHPPAIIYAAANADGSYEAFAPPRIVPRAAYTGPGPSASVPHLAPPHHEHTHTHAHAPGVAPSYSDPLPAHAASVQSFHLPAAPGVAVSHRSAVAPSHHSAVAPSHHSAVAPSHHSAVAPSHHSAIAPSHHSAIAPSHHSSRPSTGDRERRSLNASSRSRERTRDGWERTRDRDGWERIRGRDGWERIRDRDGWERIRASRVPRPESLPPEPAPAPRSGVGAFGLGRLRRARGADADAGPRTGTRMAARTRMATGAGGRSGGEDTDKDEGSDSSGSTYYVLPSPGQKVRIIRPPEEPDLAAPRAHTLPRAAAGAARVYAQTSARAVERGTVQRQPASAFLSLRDRFYKPLQPARAQAQAPVQVQTAAADAVVEEVAGFGEGWDVVGNIGGGALGLVVA